MNAQAVHASAAQRWAGLPAHTVAQFRPLFVEIAAGAAERERTGRRPVAELEQLRRAGFTLARIPADPGGVPVPWREFARLLVNLAAADANLPQILRGHIALAEQALTTADGAFRRRWLARIRQGTLVGNSWSEGAGKPLDRSGAELRRADDGELLLSGRKYYTTGSLFASWTDTLAHRGSDGAEVTALVALDQPGVEVLDDWDGFGQRLTGTGTIIFRDARVDAIEVLPLTERFGYQTALYQLVLLAVLAGIGHAAVEDVAAALRARGRVYSHGLGARAREDGQLQALLGELAGIAFAVEASVLAVADAVDDAYRALSAARDSVAGDAGDAAEAARQAAGIAEIRAAQAQSHVTGQVQLIASRLFDALGASGTSVTAALDRHWRNARTVSSHNPVLYKQRWVGRWLIDGELPDPLWGVGQAAADRG